MFVNNIICISECGDLMLNNKSHKVLVYIFNSHLIFGTKKSVRVPRWILVGHMITLYLTTYIYINYLFWRQLEILL